jgi:uncharacterized caspase-like protein
MRRLDPFRGSATLSLRLISVAALAVGILFSAISRNAALADKRVALLVGNSGYQNVPRLPNPSNDATAMAQMFKRAGFDVVDLRLDISNLDFKRALREFENSASGADIAVVFFAGHGLELNGINYFIPVDAKLASDRDARDEAIALDRIFEAVDGATRLRLIIVDACRDNPFVMTMKRQASARTASRGLARVEPPGSDTLIAYATKAGATAEDGRGEHSPFTTALLNNLSVPGLDIRFAIGQVVDDVKKMTGNRQEPYWYGSLGGGAISLVPPRPPPSTVPAIPEQREPLSADMRADYELAKEIGTKDAWDAFLSTYKSGFYVNLAKAQLAKLVAAERQAEQSSAVQRAEEERRVKAAAEAERQKVEQQATIQRAEEERRAKAAAEMERQRAEQQVALRRAEDERDAKAEEERRRAAREQAERQKPADPPPHIQTTVLTPPIEQQPAATPPAAQLGGSALIQEIKKELKRVGCYSGKLDDKWPSPAMKSSIEKFAKYARLASVPNEPAVDFLDAIRENSDRVCPLECDARQVEKDGRCIAKNCPSGERLNLQGNCVGKSTATLHPDKQATPAKPTNAATNLPNGDASPDRNAGQLKLPKSARDIPPGTISKITPEGGQICSRGGGDCLPVPKGCVGIRKLNAGQGSTGGQNIYC